MAKKLTSNKAKEILHDKSVHGHPLTDKQRRFFGAIAGGAEPYKAQIGTMLTALPSNMMDRLSDALAFPQRAITKLFTGEYQTPSEAMGIQNAAGAFLTDVVLDPLGLMGLGAGAKAAKASTKTGILSKAYLKNPIARKELRDPNKSFRVAGMDAYDDFVESGVLRSYTPMSTPEMSFAERMKLRPTAFPSFQKGYADMGYLPKEGGVVFETSLPTFKRGDINPVTGNPVKGRHYAHRVIDTETGKVLSNVPGKDIKVYKGKPHWLMGYQEIKPPKKKQDGGWLDKFDTPLAQNGIEGTMGGLTDQGFNYNGAWGGTMQNGGNKKKAIAALGPSNEVKVKKYKPDYALTYAGDKNRSYPVQASDIQQIISTAIGMNYDPRKALAVALQETGAGFSDPNYFHVLRGTNKRGQNIISEEYQNLSDDELGIQILKDKEQLAHRLGYHTPEMELQTYNGLGKIFPDTERQYHGFRMKKIYGVPVPEEGIDMRKNPLYGKRVLDVKKNVVDKDKYVDQLVDHYTKFYNNPESTYYTRGTDLPPVVISSKKKLAIGGSIPGAVGFTYARTAGAAPANGPYAKKTKASAQNGQEMKYYQAGLDFKPKTISQDGSDIPVDPMGYWNPENVGSPVIIPSNVITMEGVDQPLLGISDTGDVQYMEPGEDYEFDGEYVTEYPVAQRGKKVYSSKDIKAKPPYPEYPEDDPRRHGLFNKYKPKPKPKPAPEPEKAKEVPVAPEVVKKSTLTDYFQGQSVFAPTPYHGSGAGAFVGYKTPQGDTVFVKPEDYERMGVPKYGREFIESKKKQRNGGVNNADAQPIEKLDQLLNFTNYNKPTKGGWLDKYN